MPEGDTLYRVAEQLRPVLAGETILAAESRPLRSLDAIDSTKLIGRRVGSVEALGKHLVIRLDERLAIHSHLGMTGSWHVYDHGEPWREQHHGAALVLRTAARVVVNFNPQQLQLLAEPTLRRDAYLRRLGPDLMRADVDWQAALQRLRIHDRTPIGEAVMNLSLIHI